MAVSIVDRSQSPVATNHPSWSHTVTAGSDRLLIVCVGGELGSGPSVDCTAVTYGGIPLTLYQDYEDTSASGHAYTSVWYLVDPPVGTATIVTTTTNFARTGGCAVGLQGASQSAPEAFNTGSASVTPISHALTTLTANALLLDTFTHSTETATSPAAGQTEEVNLLISGGGSGARTGISSKATTTPGSYTMRWDASGTITRSSHILFSIAPAAAGGSSGTFSVTEGDDVAAFSLLTSSDADASFAVSEGDDVAAFAVSVASDAIGLSDLSNNRTYQRVGVSRTLTISGTYEGTTPASIQARVLDFNTSAEVQTWATLASATISGGTWSGGFSAPQGGPYKLEVRSLNGSSVALATVTGSNEWAVGDVFLCIGSSTAARWRDDFTGPSNSRAYIYSGGAWSKMGTQGAAATTFSDDIETTLDIPVGFLDYGAGSTMLSGWAASDANYVAARNGAIAVGGIAGVICHVGSNDARAETIVSQSQQETRYRTLISNLRTALSDPTLPWYIMGCQRAPGEPSSSNTQWDMAREAEKAVGEDENVYLAAAVVDQPIGDGTHLNEAGYETEALRVAQTVRYHEGVATYYRGPRIVSMMWDGDVTVTVTLQHRGGTDFTPATGITGFTAGDSGGNIAITSAVRTDATTITLTLAATPSGIPTVKYQSGTNPAITGAVRDNSALALPLEYETLMGTSGSLEVNFAATESNDVAYFLVGAPAASASDYTRPLVGSVVRNSLNWKR